MELLFGVIATGITELIKLLSRKFGLELSKKIVHGIVFACVLAGTYMISQNIISWQSIKVYLEMFASAYATYNIILKPTKNYMEALHSGK